jgi:predicted RNA-binding protein (virulence factor B family)
MNLIKKRDTFVVLMEYGKVNRLKIARIEEKGYYLVDDKNDEVFLASENVKGSPKAGEEMDVFIYKDKSVVVVSSKLPLVQLEEFANLKVKFVNEQGAFVDWGLDTDLLVPFDEQISEMKEGQYYVLFVFEDEETGQLLGSQRADEFVFFDEIDVERGDEVDLIIHRESDLGINVIVNNLYKGLIFKSDLHKRVKLGDKIKGYVKHVREDGKIDILLEPLGYKESIVSNTQVILNTLADHKNFIPLTDKSDPNDIKRILGLSKKAFKRSIGHLYKQKKIDIRQDGIYLLK